MALQDSEIERSELRVKVKTLEAGVGAKLKGAADIKLLEELHEHVETLKVQVGELRVRKNSLAKEILNKEG